MSERNPPPDRGSGHAIVSPHEQGVTFIELFFDLIFVFSVTQVVGLLHGHLDPASIGRALLVFWLVWWAWTQFTWALNAADTTNAFVEIATLTATGVAFFMAIGIPGAYGDGAIWFAVAYVLVRALGLALYHRVVSVNPEQSRALRRFSLTSVGGLLAVLAGGMLGGEAQVPLWALAIGLDVLAAWIGGQQDGWGLHIPHFVERHGLFMIIALGESLIVAASAVAEGAWTVERLLVGILAVAITCGLWWTYFPRVLPALEERIEPMPSEAQTTAARDVFSLLHFPLLCGVIAYAVAVEEAVLHPDEPLSFAVRLMLAAGIVLFVGVTAMAMARVRLPIPWVRLAVVLVTGAFVVTAAGLHPVGTLAIAFGGVVLVGTTDLRGWRTGEGEGGGVAPD